MLAVALVLVSLVGVFVMDVVSDVRFRREVVSLLRGLRADVDLHAGELARQNTEREQLATAVQQAFGATRLQIASTHGVAATALDRILYYTQHSAILERLGAKYDKLIAKLRAEAERANAAQADAPADAPAESEAVDTHAEAWADVDRDLADTACDTADETTDDDMAKIVGSIGSAAGMPCG